MSIVSYPRGLEIPPFNLERHEVDANTIALWQLDGDLLDSGPNGLNLTEVGTVPYVLHGVPGRLPNISADPTAANYGTQANGLLRLQGALTIEALVRPSSTPNAENVICAHGESLNSLATNFSYILFFNSSYQLKYYSETGSGDNNFTATGGTLTANEWNHVAMVRQAGGDVEMFINGVSVGASSGLSAPTDGGSSIFWLGRHWSATPFLEGYVGTLHILDRAKSDAEILAEANRLVPSWNG